MEFLILTKETIKILKEDKKLCRELKRREGYVHITNLMNGKSTKMEERIKDIEDFLAKKGIDDVFEPKEFKKNKITISIPINENNISNYFKEFEIEKTKKRIKTIIIYDAKGRKAIFRGTEENIFNDLYNFYNNCKHILGNT